MSHSNGECGERGYLSDEMDLYYPEELSDGLSAFGGTKAGMLGPTQEDSLMEESKSGNKGQNSEASSALGLNGPSPAFSSNQSQA